MAMRRRFGRRPGRGRDPRPIHWAGTTGTTNVAGNSITEEPLIVRLDYSSLGTTARVSPSGVTCKRLVGNVAMCTNGLSVGTVTAFMGIAHIDEDETVTLGGNFDPSLNAQLTQERWLWNRVALWQVMTAVGENKGMSFDIDIKQKVRLRDSGISLIIMTGVASPGISLRYSFRCLLVGDTN